MEALAFRGLSPEAMVGYWINHIGTAIDISGVAVIVSGIVWPTARFLERRAEEQHYERYKTRIGRSLLLGLFIDPPLGRVGLTESEVRAQGINALIAKQSMESVGRAYERGETFGFMKVIVNAETKRILGAAILGIGGDEVVHTFLDVMAANAPYTEISRTVHIHPTVSEYLPVLLSDLQPPVYESVGKQRERREGNSPAALASVFA